MLGNLRRAVASVNTGEAPAASRGPQRQGRRHFATAYTFNNDELLMSVRSLTRPRVAFAPAGMRNWRQHNDAEVDNGY